MATSLTRVARFRARELGSIINTSASSGSTEPFLVQNPFLPRKNPSTGKWHSPDYSLRRQADLAKEAKRSGQQHLLPHGPKNPDPAQAKGIVQKHQASSVLKALLNARNEGAIPEKKKELEEIDPLNVQWVGKQPYATQKPSFGLYGKRRKMFKGRKWEKEVKLRQEYMEKVVDGLQEQKSNMRWGRSRKGKKPRAKYPI